MYFPYFCYVTDTNRYLLVNSRTNSESNYLQLYSSYVNVTKGTSVSFKHQTTYYTKEFAVSVRYFSSNSSRSTRSYKSEKIWSSKGNELSEFTTACVDLPSSNSLSLLFQVSAKVNSWYKNLVYLDDITVSNETCKCEIQDIFIPISCYIFIYKVFCNHFQYLHL